MKKFMDEDFLLENEKGKALFGNYANNQPIIDYHCHVSPKEIYEDKKFSNITELWLGGDHYKWRLMRSDGVEEYYITGDAPDKEKFLKFAKALPKAIGNPMYHWCHLELKRYFGYEGILNEKTAEEVWQLTKRVLSEENLSVRKIINQSNVKFIGTTDDPVDSLEYHRLLKKDESFKTVVAPSFRPDKAFQLTNAGYRDYIKKLEEASGIKIDCLEKLKKALRKRMEVFDELGCRASDHGLNKAFYRKESETQTDEIFQRAIRGESVTENEAEMVGTELLLFCAEEYKKLGWVMQIHYNCIRNPNSLMFKKIGADTGYDCIGPDNSSRALAALLDNMYSEKKMPRLILYSLDKGDNAFLDSLIGAFQQEGFPGTIQHGSAWWFNDTVDGMKDQLKSLASLGILGNFVGMLTDSRSFLSYTRHEYFRRVLCNIIGTWVEKGEYPDDDEALGEIIRNISYKNAERFFSLEGKI